MRSDNNTVVALIIGQRAPMPQLYHRERMRLYSRPKPGNGPLCSFAHGEKRQYHTRPFQSPRQDYADRVDPHSQRYGPSLNDLGETTLNNGQQNLPEDSLFTSHQDPQALLAVAMNLSGDLGANAFPPCSILRKVLKTRK